MTKDEAILRLEVLKDFSHDNELKNIHEAIDMAIEALSKRDNREIAEFPTEDDVIKVIPCEKCFYAKPYNKVWQLPKYNGVLWCTHCEEEKLPDWFCADAIERMVEE